MKKILTALSIASLSYLSAATLTTDKATYSTTDTIKINFSEMDNHNKDWIAIYPKGSSTAWKNVVKWAWTKNKSEGTLTFKNLPVGEYEVKGFYNNSYNAEVTKAFKVEQGNPNGAIPILTTSKFVFKTTEDIRIKFENINGATNDWMGIYPADKDNSWENVIKWKFNSGGVTEGEANFDKLPEGNYEARIFYNNTFRMEGKVNFKVTVSANTNERILKVANDHCLGEEENTAHILCSNEDGIVYLYDLTRREWDADYYNFYRVDNNKNHLETLEENIKMNTLNPRDYVSLKKLKDTPIYYTEFHSIGGDDNAIYQFYYKDQGLMEFRSNDRDGALFNVHTIENGKKLLLSYASAYTKPYGIHTVTYDISNPNHVIEINREIKPLR